MPDRVTSRPVPSPAAPILALLALAALLTGCIIHDGYPPITAVYGYYGGILAVMAAAITATTTAG